MRNFPAALRVGLLLVVACIGSWFLYRTIVQRSSGGTSYPAYALFHDASGLVPRSRITMAGIPVGRIEKIALQDGMARVDMLVNGDVALYEDATVSRRAASLLGEFQLVLTPGITGTRRLARGERIRVLQEGATTDDILNNVNAITVRIRQVTDRVGDVFGTDDGRRQMAETLRNVQELTAELNRTIHANSDVISHALRNVDAITDEGRPRVREILDNVREATARVDHIVASNQAGIDDTITNVDETVRNANAASRDLREALAHINSITGVVDRGEGNVGRLVRDETLVNEVEGVASGVSDILEPVSRLQTIIGLRSEFNVLSGALKSYIELRLQSREDRYLLVELVDDPRGQVARSSTIYQSTDPTRPSRWQQTEERTSAGLRFTVQLARRIGPATFRFGIRESTGGVGVDLHLFRDRLELRTDLFDFSTSTYPRLRAAVAYEVMRRIYVIGGVDDIINGDRRDYFFGAMLRFNDEDLKTTLLFAGGLLGGIAGGGGGGR